MNIQTNIPLSQLTTMRLGGIANYVAEVTSREEIQQIFKNAESRGLPAYVIGGGSNLIARDEGFAGVIIRVNIKGIAIVEDTSEFTTITAGGGDKWDDVVKFSVDRSLAGIESMSGIPGTAGAAPVQNIGAYGQELADTFISLEAYDTEQDKFVLLTWEDCDFSYRDSIFRGASAGRYIIYSIKLKLWKKVPEPPFYESLQKRFDELGVTQFSVQIVRDGVLALRETKLPDPSIVANSGSFFKNAIVEQWQLDSIKAKNDSVKHFDYGNGRYKVPAGWLIEECGLKGEVINGIKVHEGNAVVLINESAKSYADLAAARDKITSTVFTEFQVELLQEPLELGPPSIEKDS